MKYQIGIVCEEKGNANLIAQEQGSRDAYSYIKTNVALNDIPAAIQLIFEQYPEKQKQYEAERAEKAEREHKEKKIREKAEREHQKNEAKKKADKKGTAKPQKEEQTKTQENIPAPEPKPENAPAQAQTQSLPGFNAADFEE